MILQLLSLLAFLMGPAVIYLFRFWPGAQITLDAFVLIAVVGAVFTDIIPHAIAMSGSSVLVGALLGMILPFALHHSVHYCQRHRRQPWLIAIAILALSLHAMMDGIGIAAGSTSMMMAIGLHRFAEGLAVWWMLQPLFSLKIRSTIVFFLLSVTVMGHWLYQYLIPENIGSLLGWLQASVAGSLLHVMIRHSDPQEDTNNGLASKKTSSYSKWWSWFGGFLGVVYVLTQSIIHEPLHDKHHHTLLQEANSLITTHHHHGHIHFDNGWQYQTMLSLPWQLWRSLAHQPFLHIIYTLSPWILAGLFLTSCFHALLPQNFLLRSKWQFLRTKTSGIFSFSSWCKEKVLACVLPLEGVALALIGSTCGCGVMPVYHLLCQKKVDKHIRVAFLFAAPLSGSLALLLIFSLWGMSFLAWYLVTVIIMALLLSWLLADHFDAPLSSIVLEPQGPIAPACQHDSQQQASSMAGLHWFKRFYDGVHYMLEDVLHEWTAWILLSIFLNIGWYACQDHLIPFKEQSLWLSPIVLILAASPLYLHISLSLVISCFLYEMHVAPIVLLSWLVASCSTSLSSSLLLCKEHGPKASWGYNSIVLCAVFLMNFLPFTLFENNSFSLHLLEKPDLLHDVTLFFLFVMMLYSLWAKGSRSSIEIIASPQKLGAFGHHHTHA